VIPGFIDLQVNGYKGTDFSSASLTAEDFIRASEELIKTGTVLFLPTIITSSESIYKRNTELIAKAVQTTHLKNHIPGIHLEGPFISTEDGYLGVHHKEWVSKPDTDYLQKMIDWSGNFIKIITIASEVPGSEELCGYATSKDIIVSLGHQNARKENFSNLAAAGAKCITHMGNGTPQMIHRYENTLWPALLNKDLIGMIITDGFHISKELLEIMIRMKGVDKLIVTSDISPVGGLNPGTYQMLGVESVLEENGKLHCPQTNSLAGSSFTMLQCANFLMTCDFVSIQDIEKMVFYNPLQLLKMKEKDLNVVVKVKLEGKAFSI
jgi:N-acetylglucosamine-6-phosphate deacetylase